ncbi:MAG: efflux RND transporter periplasmic adaptor subunit [Gammaproteobacteria bacterium]|nr:efflux RND transporter periplasmic adaptor subunit [Gammaproteobacteria bacterium]MBU0850153.1 efflux RND transporter periplasmic adaptor subunit [Gammaproteobacteria bacterium]MBU1268641.1 efflux RND transporter periplasmic adaptor subunit [Gammaproteobacteria bacterium]MBU1530065.1 efflux RND transporter periplasmic adaptor subunit [Gammaproteobacteria bacterium]MBU1780876.1 efflux RND transporter periplasmic adaptor subunit [Gammaproteobacteria bacterium]
MLNNKQQSARPKLVQAASLTLTQYATTLATLFFLSACSPAPEGVTAAETAAPGTASLSVELVAVEQKTMPVKLAVNGSLAAWQEAIIGSQLSGVRIDSLRVEVGDTVKKGQTLAVFDQETVKADLAQARAGVAEAQALYDQANLNADMIRNITDQGAVSAQERNQTIAAEKSAQARLMSAKALQTQQEIRLRNTTVTALDDGVISSRSATLGAVPNPGQELFRLVRQQRLEWQAEVTDSELGRIKEGMLVTVFNGSQAFKGNVRTISPLINAQSRSGMVYVDVANAYAKGLKPGMYLRGEFDLGEQVATVIPQTSVIERDGFTYAFTLDEKTSQVQRIKLQVNKAQGDYIEVLDGLKPGQKVVKSGVAFLAHGDFVKVVQ